MDIDTQVRFVRLEGSLAASTILLESMKESLENLDKFMNSSEAACLKPMIPVGSEELLKDFIMAITSQITTNRDLLKDYFERPEIKEIMKGTNNGSN